MDTNEKQTIGSGNNVKKPHKQLIDEALIEIAATVGDCVDAQSEHHDAQNEHSDLLTKDKGHIKALQQQNLVLQKKLECSPGFNDGTCQ